MKDILLESIFVTKPFLPPISDYQKYVNQIFNTNILTNQGPLVKELEEKLKSYLGVNNLHYVTNGTIALQLALNVLDIKEGEIITTPFSYVATISSILWERCTPVFVDIEPENFTINADEIEQKITPKTKAILAVHVFGFACNVEKIEEIAAKYNLKTIYDGAHAFGTVYKDKSLLSYGDISTCSFHSTKLFHTVEGGACIIKDKEISDKLNLVKRFGHLYDDYLCLGINAKNSEVHAAMGLANFTYINEIIEKRKLIVDTYNTLLPKFEKPRVQNDLKWNYSYYPILFENEEKLKKSFELLNKENIFPRRYFWPSLNTLPYVKGESLPTSEDISSRIACLPLYVDLSIEDVERVTRILNNA